MSTPLVRSFYRLARSWPPDDRDYQTRAEWKGPPPPELPDHLQRPWFGWSAFDSESAARAQGRRTPGTGQHIVRYNLPVGGTITWEKTFGPGHWTLYGASDDLRAVLAADYHAMV